MAVTVKQEVAALYSAIFNRAPDQAGLEFWVEAINGGDSLTKAAEGFTQHPVFAEVYGDLSNQAKVEALYTNVLGSAGDAAGIQFWVAKLESGVSFGQVVAEFVSGALTIDLDALLDSGELSQADYDAAVVRQNSITNKADAGVYFADTFGAASNLSASTDTTTKEGLESDPVYLASQAAIAGVTNDAATLAAAKAAIDAAEAPTDLNVAPAFTLTAGAETIAGTANADTIEGISSALSSARTLDATDKIDGGEGADTLKVDLQSNFAGFTGEGFLKNVETVELTNAGTIAREFNATGVTGVEKYNLSGQVNLTDLADAKAAVSLSNIAENASVSIGYTAPAVAGTADALSLSVNSLGTAAVKNAAGATTTNQKTVTVTANGVETLALNTAGDNFVALVGDKAAAITVAGTGSLTTGVTAATKTFDASANAGAVKVDLANAVAGAVSSVATGAGDDVITSDVGDLVANATINGGAGSDRLELTGTGTTTQFQMSGVETVSLGTSTTALTGTTVFSAAKASGIETIDAQANFATGATASFAGMGANGLQFNLLGNNTGAGTISADQTGASTINVVAGQGATATAQHANDVDVTASNSSSVKLNVGVNTTYTGTITAGKATSVEVGGNVSGNANIIAATATAAVLNTTGASTLDLDAVKLTDLNVTVAAGTTTTAGSLALTGSTLTGVEALKANIGSNSTFTVGDLAKANSVQLSGAGTAVIGSLGTSTQEYGVTVNAAGLKGLTISTTGTGITTAAGQSVSVNASSVLGAVTLGDIAVGTGATTGSANVNVNGTTGAVSLGTVSAKDVTIDAAGALGGITYDSGAVSTAFGVADISVGGTLVINGADLSANTVDIAATGASLNATLNGGIQADIFHIQGAAGTLSYVVGGDLEIGSNVVTVNAAAQNDVAKSVTIDTSALKGTGTVTLTGGTGNDTIKLGAATETVVVGTKAAAGMDTITGFTVGTDKLTLIDNGTEVFTKAAVVVTGAADLDAALNLAAASDGASAGLVKWFVFGGDTYVVQDNTAAATFTAATDAVVKLAGVLDLSTLTEASFNFA